MVVWDFNENKNYIQVGNYKVLDKPDFMKAVILLEEIYNMILNCYIAIEINEPRTPELNILLTTPFYLQEMQLEKDQGEIIFEGLNKPKNIKTTRLKKVGKDGNLRASYRLIFLKLRDSNDKVKNINRLKNLISHELAHTAVNHVVFRENDHDEEFEKYNKLIRKYI
tara:strand:- start:1121 stop:1621 length:501 start_codon:yes stop_codon:yes gene_type:complete